MVLIIDDDPAVNASIELLLWQKKVECHCISNPESVMGYLSQNRPQLILLDMNFSINTSGEEGLSLLHKILGFDATIPVILMTGWATIDLAIKGMKAGAKDFISKPWDNDHLLQSIETVLAITYANKTSKSKEREQLDALYDFSNLIGNDPVFLDVLEKIGKIAQTDASVLILGENGTGKELIAEAIHVNSLRKSRPFVKVNLGGISTALFESELFGHKRGAYTGAISDRKGRFLTADKGTIFLDEIGELSLDNQVKLLRVLQDRSFEVLGSSQTRKVDVRIISATNRDLEKEVVQKSFREDLFYRINLITLRIPALRERPKDIPLLVKYFLENFRILYKKPDLRIGSSAMNWLERQYFPGNIRQLRNLVERTVLISSNNVLQIDDFRNHQSKLSNLESDGPLTVRGNMTLEEMEKEMIIQAMNTHGNKVARVADELGISRNALYRRLTKFNIAFQ